MKHKETLIGVLVLTISSALKIGSLIALYSVYSHKQESIHYAALPHDSYVTVSRQ